MQRATAVGAQSHNIAGIGWNFRFIQYNVEHGCDALLTPAINAVAMNAVTAGATGTIHSRSVCRSVTSGTIFAGTEHDINSCCFPVQSQEVARRYVFKGVFANVIFSVCQLHRSLFLPVFYLAVLSARVPSLRWLARQGASASL